MESFNGGNRDYFSGGPQVILEASSHLGECNHFD